MKTYKHSDEWFKNWTKPKLVNGMNERGYWIDYVENLEIGFGLDLSKFCYINAKHKVSIGDECMIGSFTSILSSAIIGDRDGRVSIGNNVCIGSHSLIMPNVVIGNNVVIPAYSYIDRDIKCDTYLVPRQKYLDYNKIIDKLGIKKKRNRLVK